jgi:hypothetical protein
VGGDDAHFVFDAELIRACRRRGAAFPNRSLEPMMMPTSVCVGGLVRRAAHCGDHLTTHSDGDETNV